MKQFRTHMFLIIMLISVLLESSLSYSQTNSPRLSMESNEILYCDYSSPAVIITSFSDASNINVSQIKISIQKNIANNTFAEYTDAFGDKLYHTTHSTTTDQIISRTSIGAGNQAKGTYSLKLILTLTNSSNIQLTSNDSRISISRNERGDIEAMVMITLQIEDSFGGERRKTYTYEDLKAMTTGELIVFFIMVLVNNYAWLIVLFIAIWLWGRYRGYRKLVF